MRAGETEGKMASDDKAVEERIPAMQQLLDDPSMLLFLGITVPTVFYLIWGIMEAVSIPLAK